jgi:hypothetical protein
MRKSLESDDMSASMTFELLAKRPLVILSRERGREWVEIAGGAATN